MTAIEQGYYESVGLDVTIVPSDPAAPMPVDAGDAEFIVSWVPAVLVARERDGSDLIDIAQIAQRSGTLSLAWRDSAIAVPKDLAGKRLGILAPLGELEIAAATTAVGLAPGDPSAVVVGSSVAPFLGRDVDAIQALVYDGYASVLEATDPSTGGLYQPTQLDVINYADHDTAMLQDAIFASAAWLAEDDHEEVATAFLAASFRGWVACRDDPEACVAATVAALDRVAEPAPSPGASASAPPTTEPSESAAPSEGASPTAAATPAPTATPVPRPGAGHLAWMLNEYHPLVWPSPDGIGIVDETAWADTVEVLLDAGILRADPGPDAWRSDLATSALTRLEDVDAVGLTFEKGFVDITRGGS